MTINRVTSDGTESSTEPLFDIVDANGNAVPVDVIEELQADGSLETVWQRSTGDVNLAQYVPERAIRIRDEAPDDIRTDLNRDVVDASGYDGRDGDVGTLIENAASNGEVVDFGNGTYEMQTRPDIDTFVAIAGDGADIHLVSSFAEGVTFNAAAAHEVYMQGINFHVDVDNALLTTFNTGIRDYAFFEDIQILGQRDHHGGNGHRMNFLLQMQDGGESFVHRLRLPDGDTPYDGIDDDYAIPISADPSHHGYNVYKDCYVSGFYDNGYYLMSGQQTGASILWDCKALNNARGNMRLGVDDVVIGGRTEVNTDFEPIPNIDVDRSGTPFVGQDRDARVYGLTMVAEGDNWGADVIQLRDGFDTYEFENCIVHVKSGSSRPIRANTSGVGDVYMRDMYILDEGSNNHTFHIPEYTDGYHATLYLEDDLYIEGGGDEFQIDSTGEVRYNGSSYTSDTSASALGIPSVTEADFPEFYWDFSERAERINLAPYVPDQAYNIYQNKPGDIREDLSYPVVDASGYDNRSGDLSEAIRQASQNGEILDLGSGTYEMQTMVSSSDTGNILAIAGDDAEIYYANQLGSDGIAFGLGSNNPEDEVYMQGLIFDNTEADNALVTTFNTGIANYAFFEDIRLRGQRWPADGGGHSMNFMINMQEGGEALMHRVEMPDGDKPVAGAGTAHGIGAASDPPHNGYNVWKDCTVNNWRSNGFYLLGDSTTGPNVVWNCTAINNARTGIRVGNDDIVIGGRAEANSNFVPNDDPATPVGTNNYTGVEVYGLTVVTEGSTWNDGGHSNAVRVRTDAVDPHFEKLKVHVKDAANPPIRVDTGESTTHATFTDCWVLDESTMDHTYYIGSEDAFGNYGDVTFYDSDGGHYLEGGGGEIDIGSNNTFTYNGTDYSGQTLSASDLGIPTLSEPDLPEFHFDFSDR